MKYGIDTQTLVDATQNLATIEYIDSKVKGAKIAVSSVVWKETYGVLIRMGQTKEHADGEIKRAIKELNGKEKEYSEEYDAEAERILNSYKEMKDNEKDHKILAHYKGIGVETILVRDREFEKVISKEGLNILHIPTKEKLLDWKLRKLKLFR
ncbi:MAG: hypothetical protein DRP85_09670 [Candidatus Makaraimicrobium thalassicum]|nr:MAG: hypothetical protein DRP85_09670 [Candidatus Omnitrophota bacterium]